MLRPSTRRLPFAFLLALSAAPLACVGVGGDGESGAEERFDDEGAAVVSVPPKGTLQTLDIAEWNTEWLGHTGFGPTDEALQLSNVRDVIKGTDFDIWALEEVVAASSWSSLKAQLPGYSGLLANDPIVTQGSSYYTTGEQKVGILYKTDVATVQSARIILTGQDFNFGGRPPLEVKLTVSLNGSTTSLVIIVLHAKAMADADSYARRKAGGDALKAYLDSTYPTERVLVAGDYNDDLDFSIAGGGQASPYKGLVDDTARYLFPTKAFTDAGLGTTTSSSTAIDHQMITNELAPLYVAGSAEVYKVNAFIPQYSSTTSDHYPTLTRYSLAAAAPKLLLNEICANEPGSATAGEFVEIVNVGGGTADLSGFGVFDATGVRHVFPAGSALLPGKAVAVFGGAAGIPAGLSNAVVASTGTLNLANGGDTVTLKDGAGAVVDSFTYTAALASVDGVSMNRSPDATAAGVFALHTSLVTAPSSPGKRATGGDF
jgi:endonuclease/exonuclease/phosphatase family metal-dependent hydrolase